MQLAVVEKTTRSHPHFPSPLPDRVGDHPPGRGRLPHAVEGLEPPSLRCAPNPVELCVPQVIASSSSSRDRAEEIENVHLRSHIDHGPDAPPNVTGYLP